MLLTLAGVLRPLAGEIWSMGERDRSSLAGRARQGPGCHDRRSLDLLQPDRARKPAAARGRGDVLALFPELDQLLDRPAALLSGGEQQMLGLAAVLSRQPKLLLIDELSFGLAPRVVQRLMKAVRDAADSGTAVVIVEQLPGWPSTSPIGPTCSSTDGWRLKAAPTSCGRNVGEIESKYLGVH